MGIEKQLFKYDSWDELEVGVLYFYNVHLITDIGEVKAGTRFDGACINMQEGTISLENVEGKRCKASTFKFRLEITDDISPSYGNVGIDGIGRSVFVEFLGNDNVLKVYPCDMSYHYHEYKVEKSVVEDGQLYVDLEESGCYKFSIKDKQVVNFGRVC